MKFYKKPFSKLTKQTVIRYTTANNVEELLICIALHGNASRLNKKNQLAVKIDYSTLDGRH